MAKRKFEHTEPYIFIVYDEDAKPLMKDGKIRWFHTWEDAEEVKRREGNTLWTWAPTGKAHFERLRERNEK